MSTCMLNLHLQIQDRAKSIIFFPKSYSSLIFFLLVMAAISLQSLRLKTIGVLQKSLDFTFSH